MTGRSALVPLLALLPAAAAAQAADLQIVACDQAAGIASARNLWMPPDSSVRLFANGAVRFFWLDIGEPACCSSYLMVVQPAPADPGELCRIVSMRGGLGFGGMNLAAAPASYDPATGLTVSIPVNLWQGDGPAPASLSVTVNQATGGLSASFFPW